MKRKKKEKTEVALVALFFALGSGAAPADTRPHVVVLVTTVADAPLPASAEQRVLADLVGPLHVRLDRVHHVARFVDGRSACAGYPGIDAVLSVETRASFLASPQRPWPSLEKVPAVRWTPREINVKMHYAITNCSPQGITIASDQLERRYDPMTMREADDQRQADAIVRTAEALSAGVGDRWSRLARP